MLEEVEGGPALPPPSVKAPLALRAANTAPLAPRADEIVPLALGKRAGKVQVAKSAPVRNCQKCQQPVRGHPGPTGMRQCSVATVSLALPLERLRSPPGDQSLSLDTTVKDSDRLEASYLPASPPMSLPELPPTSSDSPSPCQTHTLSQTCQPPALSPSFTPSQSSSPYQPWQPNSQSLPPAIPLPPQPLAPGQYVCLQCSGTCKDTDIQPLGCSIEDCYGSLEMHPALVRVWPVCCSSCWSALWNLHMGYTSQGGDW